MSAHILVVDDEAGIREMLTTWLVSAGYRCTAVSDAPDGVIKAQLRGIVGIRMPITRLDGKRKMSQRDSAEDREGVIEGLSRSGNAQEAVVAALVPR